MGWSLTPSLSLKILRGYRGVNVSISKNWFSSSFEQFKITMVNVFMPCQPQNMDTSTESREKKAGQGQDFNLEVRSDSLRKYLMLFF
jgi:hypothetical protein